MINSNKCSRSNDLETISIKHKQFRDTAFKARSHWLHRSLVTDAYFEFDGLFLNRCQTNWDKLGQTKDWESCEMLKSNPIGTFQR